MHRLLRTRSRLHGSADGFVRPNSRRSTPYPGTHCAAAAVGTYLLTVKRTSKWITRQLRRMATEGRERATRTTLDAYLKTPDRSSEGKSCLNHRWVERADGRWRAETSTEAMATESLDDRAGIRQPVT